MTSSTHLRSRFRRARNAAGVAGALALVGAGVGVTAAAAKTAANSTPASALNALLTSAQNGDLVGALGSIAPGERSAIGPELAGLIRQLQHLNVLSSSVNANHISGITFNFSGIHTTTSYLDNITAAVLITNGTVTTGADFTKFPFGSFVTGILGGRLKADSKTHTQSAATGNSPIVTVNEDGSWYVVLATPLS